MEAKLAQKSFRNFDIAKLCCFWTIDSSTTSEYCTYGGLRVMMRRSSIGVDLRSCLLTWVITSLGGSAVSAVTVISVGHLTVRTSFSHENMGLMSRDGLWHTVTITVLLSGEDNCHKHQVIFVYHTCYCEVVWMLCVWGWDFAFSGMMLNSPSAEEPKWSTLSS